MSAPPVASTSTTAAAAPAALDTTSAVAEAVFQRRRGSARVRETFAALAAQEKALQADPKWKKYSSLVEKTLQSFEQVQEWADFQVFLAKLLKCLQAYREFPMIPHKLTVAKRLSQCLNPALPTGVHQRALDLYTHILTTIGPENLRRDLPAWSSGLFTFFQYAATSVKPIVLGIFERFYLPLQESLRPATKAVILALLPGLEEETGEFFEKVAALLDRVSGTVSPSFFFQNLWLVLITAPNSRIPALNYLAKRLPKMEAEDSVSHIVGQDVGLMIRGFAAALEDPQILVQRGVLDLLTTTLKLDSEGFKSTRRDDQILLMRAVTGVVLRRDLSLSRRLYTWLLGSAESSEAQVTHLKEHGLELLRSALKMDMDAQTTESTDRQRPFKIFISLLDKWDIGAPLTEVLVLDAFSALRNTLRPDDDHDELLMTGNMLFEILDPFLMWKQVFLSVKSTIEDGASDEPIALARFIVHTFRLHDEEVQKLHAPFLAFSMIDMVEAKVQKVDAFDRSARLWSAVSLANDLLHEISTKLFEATDTATETPTERLGLSLAESLYGAPDMKTASLPETEGREILASGFATTIRLIERCAAIVASSNAVPTSDIVQLLLASLSTIYVLSDATSHSNDTVQLPWRVDDWTNRLMSCLESSPASVEAFELHSTIVSVILTLAKTPALQPPLRRNRRPLIEALAAKLLDYLQPACAPCFVEAVRLLWGVEALSDRRHVESMISMRLAAPVETTRLAAFEAFGNLWRFTEDAQLPGVVLRMPMFKMLDSLKSEDLATRRAGEAWMRCSLKSYIRVLDPLLFTLLDPSIKQQSVMLKVSELRVPVLQYSNAFDQARVHHVLDDLLSLARFGGQGFIRIAKSAFLKHSLDPAFRQRVMDAELDTHTYLDGLIAVLVRLLRSEPSPELVPSLGPLNSHVHSVVAELLQVIISRGEAEVSGLNSIESALASRLFLCVHRAELDLQNKLLHVLHSVVHAVSNTTRRHHKSPSLATDVSTPHEAGTVDDAHPPNVTREALFVRIVSDAVSMQQNNAVIHHWIDFLLMTIPQFRLSLQAVIFPLIDCLVDRLRILVTDFSLTYTSPAKTTIPSTMTDAEFTVLVNALERLLLIAAAQALTVATDEEPKSSDRATSDAVSSGGAGGLLGYMTGVLGNSEVEQQEISEETRTKHAALRRVRDSVDLLLFAWEVTSVLEAAAGDDSSTSRGHFASRARTRTRKALERIYKAAPADVLDDVIVYWWKNRSTQDAAASKRIYAMTTALTPNAQAMVSMICEKLGSKGPSPVVDRNKSPYAAPDDASFAFLEAYIDRMDGAAAVQIWSVCLNFVRDSLSNLSTSRPYIFSCLRCFTTLSEKVSQTSALEDRRMRRDLQETFIRLADASIQLAGRAMEQSGWLRRAAVEGANGDSDSIMSRETKEHDDDDEKRQVTPAINQAQEVADFMSRRVLADFRRFLIDADKTVAVCSNMVYYIVAPAFKTRSKTFDIDPTVFELLNEMAKNPQTIKAWRTQVSDAFSDNRFFNAPPSANARWKPLIQALMSSDKERLVELTSRISTVASANIFTNRELESLSRALSLRRLTYVLFTGEKDRYLTQLPLIQEKLVDLLRSPVGDMVHAEIYLCLRVLFCRIGNQHLTGLWPVILTELLRLFESLVDHNVPDKSELLQLVLSACKFLDLTLVLQTEDFQIHEWMFVTDTVDAIYPPDNWLPQAIMDRLGELIHNPYKSIDTPPIYQSPNPAASPATSARPGASKLGGRRPLLATRRIDSIGELEPFFSGVSLAAYESVYNAGGKIDTACVERMLERDIFDGQQ